MKPKLILKTAIVLEWLFIILTIAFYFFFEDQLPMQLQEYLEWESNQVPSIFEYCDQWFSLFLFIIYFIASIFLFFLKRRAMWFYIISSILNIMLTATGSPTVEHAYVSTVDLISIFLSGFIIAILLFTDALPSKKPKIIPILQSKFKKPAKYIGAGFLLLFILVLSAFTINNSPPLNKKKFMWKNMQNSNYSGGYECTVPNWFSDVWICFDNKSGETFAETFERGYLKVQWTYSEIEKIKSFACINLLRLKNDSWLDDYEFPVSNKQFISRIKISSISVDEDDSFEINFYDDNLFFGHLIYIRVDASFNIYDAGIQG